MKICFTFFSKKKEHIDKIFEAIKYAEKESDDGSDNFYDFLDFLGLDAVFDGYIEDYDESPQAELGGFSCYINLKDIEPQFVSTSKYILDLIESIEKHFKEEMKVFFLSYCYDLDEENFFYCNDKDGIFYPYRYFVMSTVDDDLWFSPNYGEWYCNAKELIDEVTEAFDLKPYNAIDALYLKKAEKEDQFIDAVNTLQYILEEKFPYTVNNLEVTEVEIV